MSKEVVEAINDLTRVIIAVNGKFESKSDAIRVLHALKIPSARIAAILALPQGDVTSVIAKAKKAKVGRSNG